MCKNVYKDVLTTISLPFTITQDSTKSNDSTFTTTPSKTSSSLMFSTLYYNYTTTNNSIYNCLNDGLIFQSMVGIKLPYVAMECQSFLDYVLSINQSPNFYCQDTNLGKTCCISCLSNFILSPEYDSWFNKIHLFFQEYRAMKCADEYFECPYFKEICNIATLGGQP